MLPDLDALSNHTVVEEIEFDPESLTVVPSPAGGFRFAAATNVYVTLQYGRGKNSSTATDSFPGWVEGHVDKRRKIHFDQMTVDCSSFYE